MTLRPLHVWLIILAGAVLGFAVFGILAARVILDETKAKGDRLLVWAE